MKLLIIAMTLIILTKPVLASDSAFAEQFSNIEQTQQAASHDVAVSIMQSLGYSTLATVIERFSDYCGYLTMAKDLGLITSYNVILNNYEIRSLLQKVDYKLSAPLWVHGFYAFASFDQRYLIKDMDSVSFGWARMDWCETYGARLNTTRQNGNHWAIPIGYEIIAEFPYQQGANTHLSIFMDTTMGLQYLVANERYRQQAINAILHEATRTYTAIGRSPFNGVTINFEGLRGDVSKNHFTAFLTALEHRLRAENLSLYVTVHPATIDGIYFDGYDLRRIGQLADKVILMAHDYHPRSLQGFLGSQWQRNAALTPIAEVYNALRVITCPLTGVYDRSKIAVAFSFANVGWFINRYNQVIYPYPVTPSIETVYRRMNQESTYFGWCEYLRNPYIIYTTEDYRNVFLWHENYQSIAEKIKLARLFGITGTSVWRLGMIPNFEGWCVWQNFSNS